MTRAVRIEFKAAKKLRAQRFFINMGQIAHAGKFKKCRNLRANYDRFCRHRRAKRYWRNFKFSNQNKEAKA